MTLGNCVLLNEECVLTVLEPILELIDEQNFIPEKLMFFYEQSYIFITKINRISNSSEITSFLESLVYKPVFKKVNRSKNYRFVIFELASKIPFSIVIPKLPTNIMDIFSSKNGLFFEIQIFSLNPTNNIYLEANTVAKMKDDMTIEIERNNIIDEIHNGSPIFINMNGSKMMIGLFCFSKLKIIKKKVTGYLLNYTTPFCEIGLYQFEQRETMMTQETCTDTRNSFVKYNLQEV